MTMFDIRFYTKTYDTRRVKRKTTTHFFTIQYNEKADLAISRMYSVGEDGAQLYRRHVKNPRVIV